ncbi:MAG: YdcF family protein [Rhodospirillales bacterium]|nr:YdcF family protein [Rhodospirillales bacterium]
MRRSPRRRWLRLGLMVLLLAVAAWTAGLFRFAAAVPDHVADADSATDAIVVLTGGSERLETGLRLLAEKKARKLFVSGVYEGVDIAQLLRLSRQVPDEVECCIVLGYSAGNTRGNAAETAAWMAAENFRSLRLVTANYHMPRSLLEFTRAMSGLTIVPHPVFPDGFKRRDWWRWPGTTHLVASEYTKYLVALARHFATGKGDHP